MAKALKCDRCGDFYEYHRMGYRWGHFNNIRLIDTNKNGNWITLDALDLCPKCCGELIKWLGDEKEEGEEDGRE